jgi:hypothetical protein
MKRRLIVALTVALAGSALAASVADARTPRATAHRTHASKAKPASPVCHGYGLVANASTPLGPVTAPPPGKLCEVTIHHGYPVPDAGCTPGAINPSLTLAVLRDARFRTACVRDKTSTPTEKEKTYFAYAASKPHPNAGLAQVCELDHLISLELGGSDGVDNIWPQCGPASVLHDERYFHRKDIVENYLADQVEKGVIDLATAQRGIAADWTQYLPAAEAWHPTHKQKRQSDK